MHTEVAGEDQLGVDGKHTLLNMGAPGNKEYVQNRTCLVGDGSEVSECEKRSWFPRRRLRTKTTFGESFSRHGSHLVRGAQGLPASDSPYQSDNSGNAIGAATGAAGYMGASGVSASFLK